MDWNANGGNGAIVKRDGNRLANDPPYIGNARAEFSKWNFSTALSLQAVGRQYIDNSADRSSAVAPYAVLNWDVGYRFTRLNNVAKPSNCACA